MSVAWFGDLPPALRVSNIRAIVRKDLRSAWVVWLVVFSLALLVAFLLAPGAAREAEWRGGGPRPWTEPNLTPVYAVSVVLTTVFVAGAFYVIYSEEMGKGTIRSLVLYALDINDITVAKFLAAAILGGGSAFLAFLVPPMAYFAYGLQPFPDFLLIAIIAFFSVMAAIVFGAFLAHMLMAALRSYKSPASYGGAMAFFALLTTKTAVVSILLPLVLAFTNADFRDYDSIIRGVDNFAGGVAWFSPIHVGGRLLGGLLGLHPPGFDLFVVLGLFLLVVPAGFLLARRVHLDVVF